jgi:hypothetical protein
VHGCTSAVQGCRVLGCGCKVQGAGATCGRRVQAAGAGARRGAGAEAGVSVRRQCVRGGAGRVRRPLVRASRARAVFHGRSPWLRLPDGHALRANRGEPNRATRGTGFVTPIFVESSSHAATAWAAAGEAQFALRRSRTVLRSASRLCTHRLAATATRRHAVLATLAHRAR